MGAESSGRGIDPARLPGDLAAKVWGKLDLPPWVSNVGRREMAIGPLRSSLADALREKVDA